MVDWYSLSKKVTLAWSSTPRITFNPNPCTITQAQSDNTVFFSTFTMIIENSYRPETISLACGYDLQPEKNIWLSLLAKPSYSQELF